ncbi:hypothetical protein CIT26_20655 [Mesorhizobium temperatum]|uniref:Uncharacterized protein n=1 Tax=Mesorhizobium temperatum TaxID=241416 RepID=A0A271LKI3_9HYPH|nr:hypothetical protein CIT26_20655 [Mesorhizobium temperatum]
MGTLREGVVRAVVHYLVSDNDVDAAAKAIRSILQAEPPTRYNTIFGVCEVLRLPDLPLVRGALRWGSQKLRIFQLPPFCAAGFSR